MCTLRPLRGCAFGAFHDIIDLFRPRKERTLKKRLAPNSLYVAVLALLASLVLSCDESVKPVDLTVVPPTPRSFSSRTEAGSVLLRWDFLNEVSPTVSFSGYMVYLSREGWDDGFQPWTQFETKSGSRSFLPLLKRVNSLADDHMEVRVVGLQAGYLHSLYVVGVQNGNEGSPTGVVDECPFRIHEEITMREQKGDLPGWYIPGWNEAPFLSISYDRIGYLFDSGTEKDYLLFQSIDEGGWLRLQRGGEDAGEEDPPTDEEGNVTGFHADPWLDRFEIEEGDFFFILDTNGTPDWPDDDHFSRVHIKRIIHYTDGRIIIDCDYQPRANTPIL